VFTWGSLRVLGECSLSVHCSLRVACPVTLRAANRLNLKLPISDGEGAVASSDSDSDYPGRNPRATTHTLKSQKRNDEG